MRGYTPAREPARTDLGTRPSETGELAVPHAVSALAYGGDQLRLRDEFGIGALELQVLHESVVFKCHGPTFTVFVYSISVAHDGITDTSSCVSVIKSEPSTRYANTPGFVHGGV